MNWKERLEYENLKEVYVTTESGSEEEKIARQNILDFYDRIDGDSSWLRN